MKNIVISFSKGNQRMIYLRPLKRKKREDDLQYNLRENHRIRLKMCLFRYMFAIYHPEMDFTLMKEKGWIQKIENERFDG